MEYENKRIPEHAITHKGCPRCSGTKRTPMRIGNVWGWAECDFYGQSYRVADRMMAELMLEKE